MKQVAFVLVFLLLIVSCAKRGSPSGGPLDKNPPQIIKSSPENYSTNFNSQEIKIYFDEYVKLNDLNKQLIVSPPLKFQPIIYPQGGASKYIKIEIIDTLQSNTTYSFNFGNSIVDNNEGNPYPFYRYVFSTGETIDSLKLRGSVKDALNHITDNYVSVLLYTVDSTYTDSVVYKEKPRYITNTLDSATTFQFDNLKAGSYKLIALKEESNNYIFNQAQDKIAFLQEDITIPTDKAYLLNLFQEVKTYKAIKPKHERKNRIRFRFEGPYSEQVSVTQLASINNLPADFESRITKDIETDTLNYWFKPALELDSLLFNQQYKQEVDTFKVRLRKKVKQDSLSFKKLTTTLELNTNYEIVPNIPIIKIDTTKIKVIDKDSAQVSFKVLHDVFTNKISFVFDKKESERYNLTALPTAFTDFYGQTNDTLVYRATTKSMSKYGTIKVSLGNAPKATSVLVQLVDGQGEVKYEMSGKDKSVFDFLYIKPAKYRLRVVFDVNNNNEYDSGNYLQKKQPERVSYYPEEIEIRANWDIDQTFTLK